MKFSELLVVTAGVVRVLILVKILVAFLVVASQWVRRGGEGHF